MPLLLLQKRSHFKTYKHKNKELTMHVQLGIQQFVNDNHQSPIK